MVLTILTVTTLLAFRAEARSARPDTAAVTVAVLPDTVLIERGEGRRFVNFDLVLTNGSRDSVELFEIMLSVKDGRGRLVMQRLVNENGMVPSIETVPHRRIAPGGTATVFNPFHDFPSALPLDTLAYDFRL